MSSEPAASGRTRRLASNREVCRTSADEELLPVIPCLPWAFRGLALHVLRDPRTSSDHLLILADGIAEAAEASQLHGHRRLASSLGALADQLRTLAPGYAARRSERFAGP